MRKKEYDLFRLQVRSDKKLVASFFGAEEDERLPPRELPPAELGVNEDARDLIRLLTGQLYTASINEEDLEKLGERLYAALFPGRIGALFEEKWQKAKDNGRGLRLSITVEQGSEVLGWPLEFVKGPPHISWLASRRDLTLSRRVTFVRDFRLAEPAKRPLRVLIVVSKPDDQDGVLSARVIEQICKWATKEQGSGEGSEAPIRVTVLGILDDYEQDIPGAQYLGEEATFRNFRKYANDLKPHILHFIGHGEIRDQKGCLALVSEEGHSDWLSAKSLAEMVIDFNPRLVVLQACQTAQKEAVRESNSGFLSMAEYLVRNLIPAVVAMQFEVQNDYAIEFAIGFYEALARGLEVDAAVQEGRSNIVDLYQWKERYFGAPVLFMDTPYVIVELVEEAAASPRLQSERRDPAGPEPVFPGLEALARRSLEHTIKAVEGGIWNLAKDMLQDLLAYNARSGMDPGQSMLMQRILNGVNRRIDEAEQAELDGDQRQVEEIVYKIREDLELCSSALKFGGASRSMTGLQPQAGSQVPARPGLSRTGPQRDSFPPSPTKTSGK